MQITVSGIPLPEYEFFVKYVIAQQFLSDAVPTFAIGENPPQRFAQTDENWLRFSFHSCSMSESSPD
jgi:hypothetical protein